MREGKVTEARRTRNKQDRWRMTEAGTRRGDRELLWGSGVSTDSSKLTLS